MKYGETHVWDHTRMRRYPAGQKVQARQRHASDFKLAGFDPKLIQADDRDEVTRYTVWAWQQLEASLSRTRMLRNARDRHTTAKVVDASTPPVSAQVEEIDMTRVDALLKESASIVSTYKGSLPAVVEDSVMPGFAFREQVVEVPDQDNPGRLVQRTERIVSLSNVSVRQCDSCTLSGNCPAYEAGATCKLHMPVEIKSRDQLLGVLTTALEVQWQRVAFGRMAEELEGGYPNANLSAELDRLFRLITAFKDVTDNRDTLSLTVKGGNAGAAGGLLARLFGQQMTEPLRSVDPNSAEDVLRNAMK